jgi:transcriptional regulator with XRE-family HTH domain
VLKTTGKLRFGMGKVYQKRQNMYSHLRDITLAFDSGLHRTYISLIERGKRSPSLRTLERIVNALDLQLSVMIKDMENLAGKKHADS